MQSTVAPPLAYAWPPRFIFVNPLPAGSPSRLTVEICPKELKSKKCEIIELILFSPSSSSFQFMINYFWNMKQMGPN